MIALSKGEHIKERFIFSRIHIASISLLFIDIFIILDTVTLLRIQGAYIIPFIQFYKTAPVQLANGSMYSLLL